MKLFKTKEERKQQETYDFLVKFNEKNGDYYQAFYFAHKDKADDWSRRIHESCNRIDSKSDYREQLNGFLQTKEMINDFKKWCCKYKHGETFAEKFIGEKYIEMIDCRISDLNTIINDVLPLLLRADDLKQSDLFASFSVPPFLMWDCIDKLEKEQRIIRVKRGKTYYISAMK